MKQKPPDSPAAFAFQRGWEGHAFTRAADLRKCWRFSA
jgi:hypothetical protein